MHPLISLHILSQVCGGDISPWIGCDWPGLAAAFPSFSLPASSSQARANSTKVKLLLNPCPAPAPAWLAPNLRRTPSGCSQHRCEDCGSSSVCSRRSCVLPPAHRGPRLGRWAKDTRFPDGLLSGTSSCRMHFSHLRWRNPPLGPVVVFDTTGNAIAIGSRSSHMTASLSLDSNEAIRSPSLPATISPLRLL